MSGKRVKLQRKLQKQNERIDLLIAMPCPQWIAPEVFDNILGLIGYTQKHLPNVKISFGYAKDNRTDRARNKILMEWVKAQNHLDYILWLDADMLYPPDMIVKYLEHKFDIMGCLYFRRGLPTYPVLYVKKKNNDPITPYWALDPSILPQDKVIDVDAVGFGGMIVNTEVYKKMGDQMWHRYGENFHLPYKTEKQLSHDIQFCEDATKYGFTIKAHLGVKAGHISDKVISYDTYMEQRKKTKTVSVIIPTTDRTMAERAASIMRSRAGMDCDIDLIFDNDKVGSVKLLNEVVRNKEADYYVYAAQDAFPGRNWLLLAISTLEKEGKGLLGFNDGKWRGLLAGFGLVSRKFLLTVYKDQDGKPLLFYPGYKQHYGDTELTLIAMERNMYTYNPDAVLVEVDYNKDGKPVNPDDKKLFAERKLTNFDGQVKSERLINLFA